MRAIAVRRFGDPPQALDLPDPDLAHGEVLVEMDIASVNPVDWAAIEGRLSSLTAHRFPLVMGFDGVGRVQARGTGALRFEIGDTVHGQFWGELLQYGTYAERLAILESPSFGALQVVPDGVDPRLAAALPTVGMTAEGALERLGLKGGQRLLVIGATGGVGVLATQLAARANLTVIATARRDARELMLDLGAEVTLDYGAESLAQTLGRGGRGPVDGILDLLGDAAALTAAVGHLRDGGRVVSIAGGVSPQLAAVRRIAASNYILDDKPRRLRRITEELAAGRLTMPIQREVTLDEAPQAVADARRGGARGKTLILI